MICNMFRRGSEMMVDCWPYKIAAAAISSAICFLFGGSEMILLVVMMFIVLDTLTKWSAITKRYLIDQGALANEITASDMVCGFLHAWKPGYLTSSDLKQCWGEKIFAYGILIVFAGLTGKLPEIMLAGMQINKAISGGIYTYVAMTELFSIMENLEEMGNKKLALLKQYICIVVTKLTGTNLSVTITKGEDKQ